MFIKEIAEESIGLPVTQGIDYAKVPTRIAVRGVIKNADGKIAIMKIPVYWGASLPWWGVEGESLEAAVKREVLEEIGADVEDIVFFGVTREYRIYRDSPVINQSMVFSATVIWDLHEPSPSEDEKKEEQTCEWVTIEEAKAIMRKALLEDTTYGATFVLNRELLILEEYTTNFVKAGQNDAKLQELQEVAKKAQYDYVMIKSEFDSYVRRVEGENKEAKAQQLVDLAKKLLPIVTQLGQSVDHLPADLEENTRAAWVKLTYDNALKILDSMGIHRIPTIGEEPDMELHDPLSVEPTDDEAMKWKIVQEFQPWYVYEKDGVKKVIAAAKVIVWW